MDGPRSDVGALGDLGDGGVLKTGLECDRLAALPDVVGVAPATVTADHGLAIITLTPGSGPSSAATAALVHHIGDTGAS